MLTAILAFIGVAVAAVIIAEPETKRVGGIRFWRIGRLGGSFYVSKR